LSKYSETFWRPGCLIKVKVEARQMKNFQTDLKTEVQKMGKKLLTALTGVTLCLAFAANPNPILAEEDGPDLQPGVSLRQRIDANGDGTIDADGSK
jgi:hypothetical protein